MEEKITEGIMVQVESFYLKDHSNPEENHYVFAYHIRLKNLSQRTVQLMRRHWIITDSSGEVNEVKGDGVVGDQPVLAPDEEYEYTSGSSQISCRNNAGDISDGINRWRRIGSYNSMLYSCSTWKD